MPRKKKPAPKHPKPTTRPAPVSLYPLSPEQAIRGIFSIKKDDVARIVKSRPGKGKK